MGEGNLQTVERKVLGAMLIHSDDNMDVNATLKEIAKTMGYKSTGGAITFAIRALEMKNFISVREEGYKVLL